MLRQRGVTMIELLIAILIVSILAVIGAPSFNHWMQNSRIRSVAESMLDGLQLARAEAVRRNTQIRFTLTDTMTNSCVAAVSGTNWVVSQSDPTSGCAVAPSESTAPLIIRKRASSEGSTNAVVAASQSSIVFNGLGRVTPVPAANITVNVSNPTGGTCIGAGGPMRCLRIEVSTGGQVRMCDPSLSSSDPRGC